MFMLFSFLCLPISGIPLHYSRSGSFSMYEHILMSIHNVAACVFVIATVIHLILNWSALTRYILSKTSESFAFKREMIIALFVVMIVVGFFSSHPLHIH
jgi:hypothetical protein